MCEYMIDTVVGLVFRLINGVYVILCRLVDFKMNANTGYFETTSIGE